MAKVQWSYSSLKTFQTCPKKYKHVYILKEKEPQGEAAAYGSEVHKAIEEFLESDTPIPAIYQRFLPQVTPVKEWKGELHVEYKMALDANMEPCDFFSPDYFIRGIVDLLSVNGKNARVLDWKTGKSAKYADLKQLELMALMTFKHFPEVEKVSGRLVFLVPDVVVPTERPAVYLRSDMHSLWEPWLYESKRMEAAMQKDLFGPRPNELCKRFCHVLSCEHNGRVTG